MDQIIDVFGINWKLLLIQIVNFGLLLLILWYYLYRPLIKIIDARREKIEEGIKAALRSEQELSEAKSERDRIIREATEKGNQLIEDAKKRAEAKEQDMIGEAQNKVSHLLSEADKRIAREHEEMISRAEHDITSVAVLTAEKILRKNTQT